MTTPAFDALWDGQPKRAAKVGAPKSDALDAAWDAAPADPNQRLHDEFKSGRLAGRMARENANDRDEAATPTAGYGERLATHVLNAGQGIPGVRAVEAAAGSLGSKLTNQPMDYRQSLATLDGATGNIGGKTAAVERMMGGLATVPFLPGGAVAGGATLGAADQALSADPSSLGDRAKHTIVGAGIGAVAGKAGSLVGRGVANISQRTGLTDAISNALTRLGGRAGAVGEAIGTRGALNEQLANRQEILDQLTGSDKSAAQNMLDHVETYKKEAGRLYDAARADTRVVADPRVTQHLQDPDIQRALQLARDAVGGSRALPAPSPLLLSNGQGPVHPVALPTPEELSVAKRMLDAAAQRKFNAPTGIDPVEAARMVPKIDDFRAALHDASTPWRDADSYYANAKNFETAFSKAYGAQQKPTANGLDPSKLKSVEAIAAWIAKKQGTAIGQARTTGAQLGASSRVAEAVRHAPLGATLNETLDGANGVFKPSASAGTIRRMAFGSDAEAQAFTDRLSRMAEASSTKENGFGAQSASPFKPWQYLTAPNPLASPQGVAARTAISAALADPNKMAAIRQAIAGSQSGDRMLTLLQELGLSAANSAKGVR